jgi:hypothetical protein
VTFDKYYYKRCSLGHLFSFSRVYFVSSVFEKRVRVCSLLRKQTTSLNTEGTKYTRRTQGEVFKAYIAGAMLLLKSLLSNMHLWALLLCIPLSGEAQKTFDFNTNCRLAYNNIIQLKLSTGQQLLDAEKKQHPDNLIPYFLENYIDFFILFFNEDPAEYRKRKNNLDQRLEKLSEGPDSSPFYLFTKSIVHFQWAAVRIKFGYNWDAGWEFRRSFLQVKENEASFPDFYPNQLYRGAMQVAAGTIPDGYRWLSNLLGIKGTIRDGMSKLSGFLERGDEWSKLFHNEAIFYYCYLKYYVENDREGVFRFLSGQRPDLVNNHLFTYLVANLSINNHQSENAKQVIAARNMSGEYLQTSIWDLEMGYAKLNHQEPDAHIYFERFIANFRGKFYVKDALQKLSWHYYLQDNMALAHKYRALILHKGALETEADKQAEKEAKTKKWPNKLLLQARLLNDGGYHREALRLLHGKKHTDFPDAADQTEFSYRVARLYDDLGVHDEALYFYRQTIQLGESRKEYYAARSALHIGNIMEDRNDKNAAIHWYQRCMKMKDHDYKNSLDQRAKAGIARCKGE